MKSLRQHKKVHFSPLSPEIHYLHVWAYAAREARRSNWAAELSDKLHFMQRIERLAKVISPVLDEIHRLRMRFYIAVEEDVSRIQYKGEK